MSTPSTNPQTPDQQIDAVLQALRHAEPSLGMEPMQQRILQKLATIPLPRPRRTPRWLALRSAFPVALAFASLAVILTLTHLPVGKRATSQNQQASAQLHAQTSPHLPATNLSGPALASETSLPTDHHSFRTTRNPVPPPSSLALQPVPPPTLISFPAPPLPLTDQEKLLLRVAHRSDPQRFAALPPDRHDLGNDFAGLDPQTAPPLPQNPPIRPRSHIPPDFNPEPPAEPEPSAAAPSELAAPTLSPATIQPGNPSPGDSSWQPARN